MKNLNKSYIKLMVLNIILIFINNVLFGQDIVSISTGIGYPELENVSVRYQLKQAQIGLGIGTRISSKGSLISVSGDITCHFAGGSDHSKRRPVYGRFGLSYLKDESETKTDKYLYLNLRIGREINFTEKFGLAIDGGFAFQMSHEKISKIPPTYFDGIFNFEFPVLPSLGISMFYRI